MTQDTASSDRAAASATACRARRTTAICAGAASSSPTSGSPACRNSRSSAARWRMPASAAIHMPAGRRGTRLHRRRSRSACGRSRGRPALPGFKSSDQPVLATDKVRHVGEPVAVCVAATRAEAEDLAAAVDGRLRRTARRRRHARRARSPARRWCTSTGATTSSSKPCVEADLPRSAPTRRSSCAAACAPRGNACRRWRAAASLPSGTAGSSSSCSTAATQMPHIVRTGLAECLGPRRGPRPRRRARCRRRLRLQGHAARGGSRAPAGWRAALGHPVRWIEDRREQLTGNANCREHHYDITAYADADGRLLGDRLPRRRSMPAPTPPIRFPPAWRPRRSPASCPAPI